jgi:hypothetical protein
VRNSKNEGEIGREVEGKRGDEMSVLFSKSKSKVVLCLIKHYGMKTLRGL